MRKAELIVMRVLCEPKRIPIVGKWRVHVEYCAYGTTGTIRLIRNTYDEIMSVVEGYTFSE